MSNFQLWAASRDDLCTGRTIFYGGYAGSMSVKSFQKANTEFRALVLGPHACCETAEKFGSRFLPFRLCGTLEL